MKLTWYGHSAFGVEAGGAKILIDPFLTGNSSWNKGLQRGDSEIDRTNSETHTLER